MCTRHLRKPRTVVGKAGRMGEMHDVGLFLAAAEEF